MAATPSDARSRRARRGRRLVATAALAALATGAPLLGSAAAPAVAGAAIPALSDVSPRPPLPLGTRRLGQLNAATTMTGDVALKPRNAAALQAFAEAVSSEHSPLYGRYLSRGQFAADFGPSPATIREVTHQLGADHLAVGEVRDGGLLVSFSGSAREVSSAFHTPIARYRLASGRVAYSETSAPELPAPVASHVSAVVGLDDLTVPRPVGDPLGAKGHAKAKAPRTTAASSAGPVACPAAQRDATVFGGLTDAQIANAYGVDGLYAKGEAGAGETVAVYEEEPLSLTDLENFDSCYFGVSRARAIVKNVKIVPVDGGQQVGPGSGEAILDMEDVTALAPDAHYRVYEAPDTNQGYLDNYAQYVQDDNAQIMTSSWGDCEVYDESAIPGFLQTSHVLFEQAAAQGQTILNAIGDTGSDCMEEFGQRNPILSLTDVGDDPWVLGVGGTTITDATDPPAEQVWNDGSGGGAGSGGISAVWAAPAWQLPFINSKIVAKAEEVSGTDFCGAAACREAPDVTAQADEFTGAVTVYGALFGGWTTIGGTSSSSPLWAGMLADIGSTKACQAAGHELGFVTPKLYAIASDHTDYEASFNDITKGNNDAYGLSDGLYPATPGYDMASGLGSPKVTGPGGTNGLAYYLCNPRLAVPTVTHVLSTTTGTNAVPASDPGTVTVDGSGFWQFGRSDVRGVTVGNVTASFTANSSAVMTVTLPTGAEEAGNGAVNDGEGTHNLTVTLNNGNTSVPSAASTVVYYNTATSSTGNPEVDGVVAPGANAAGGQPIRIYGSGFGPAGGTASVTVGGTAATKVTVVSNNLMTAMTPPENSSACVNEEADIGPGQTSFDPTKDTCQVQVEVTVGTASSPESTIDPEYQGAFAAVGSPGTETFPAPTELDYEPTPVVSSVTVDTGEAGEFGGSEAVIMGAGLGDLGLLWFDLGSAQQESSSNYSILSVSPTELVVQLPGQLPTSSPLAVPLTVQTTGSPNVAGFASTTPPSNAKNVIYAPTPTLNGFEVLTRSGKKATYAAGPTTGGTELKLTGRGFQGAMTQSAAGQADVSFTDIGPAAGLQFGFAGASTYSFLSANSAGTELLLDSPGDDPSINQVSYCNVSGCTAPLGRGDEFTYYPLGNPTVSSVTPSTGTKGTRVTIRGSNLGFAEAVYFGNTKATHVENAATLLDSGSTAVVTAVAPAGTAGKKMEIRLVTLESEATGYGKSRPNAKVTFTYR